MSYTWSCQACSTEPTIGDTDLLPLSQTEMLLCAKHDMPFGNMVKIVCPNCSTPSLVPKDQLRPAP